MVVKVPPELRNPAETLLLSDPGWKSRLEASGEAISSPGGPISPGRRPIANKPFCLTEKQTFRWRSWMASCRPSCAFICS